MARRARWARRSAPALGAVGLAAAILGRSAVRMVQLTRGHLTYAVDDSHIHLRIAEQLSHGTYGINRSMPASASSSVLWPFLLAPFARWQWVDWVPLVLNIVFALLTTWVVFRVLRRSWSDDDRNGWWCACGAVAVLLASDAFALVFTGMEHSLQILLVAVIVLGLLSLEPEGPSPWWLWMAMIVLPLVRYEGIVVVAIAAVVASRLGHARAAIRAVGVAAAGLVAFSGFLLVLGLPALPSSVLVKAHRAAGQSLFGFFVDNLRAAATVGGSGVVPLATGVVAATTFVLLVGWRRRGVTRDAVVLLSGWSLGVISYQLLTGSSSRRYVGYAVTLVLVVAIGVVVPSMRRSLRPVAGRIVVTGAVLFVLASGYLYHSSLSGAPTAARSIYDQQYQMHRLVVEQLKAPVAVNDLGQVAFRDPYSVLDLWGLGDDEARLQRNEGKPGWVDRLMAARGVNVAMIYTAWFPHQIPHSWILVGRLHNPQPGAPGEQTVDVWARTPSWARRVRVALQRFAPSDPTNIVIEVEGG